MSSGVIILTGPPGAGKSTIAGQLARTYPKGVHLHTDDFWHYIVAGLIPPYEPASDQQNHTVLEVIAGAAFAYASGGFTTVVDGIVGPWMLDHWLARARAHRRVAVSYIVLRPGRDETLARAQGRTGSQALVAAGPILQLWDQFADLGEYEGHALDTSGEPPDESAERVAEAIAGERYKLPVYEPTLGTDPRGSDE